jgi:tetratricopeptide (TPR) repeat protein
VARHALDPDEARQWAVTALRLVREAFPAYHANYTDPDMWSTYARLLPHALVVTDHAQAYGIEPETVAWLYNEAGWYLRQRADHRLARLLHERALAIREARLGADHPDTAASLTNLALALHAQGDHDAARPLYERALSIREARLGADHPDTAHSLTNLALDFPPEGLCCCATARLVM